MNFALPERNSREFTVSLLSVFIAICEVVAKAKSSKKTMDRQCIEKLLRIKRERLLKGKKEKDL